MAGIDGGHVDDDDDDDDDYIETRWMDAERRHCQACRANTKQPHGRERTAKRRKGRAEYGAKMQCYV